MCVLGRRATLELVHHVDLWVLNSRHGVRGTFDLIQSAFRHVKGGLRSSTKSYAVDRQIMLSAERDAKKKRADASISRDQGTSVVGKQINKS